MNIITVDNKKGVAKLLMGGGKWLPKGYGNDGYCVYDEARANNPFRYVTRLSNEPMKNGWEQKEWVRVYEKEKKYLFSFLDTNGKAKISKNYYKDHNDFKDHNVIIKAFTKLDWTEKEFDVC